MAKDKAEWLPVEQAAKILGFCNSHIHYLVRRGKLEARWALHPRLTRPVVVVSRVGVEKMLRDRQELLPPEAVDW